MGSSSNAFACACAILTGAIVLACNGGGPSRSDALEAASRDAKTDALCTLPIDVLSTLKMQYATKGACVPKDLATTARVKGCMDALTAAQLTQPMPASYMREWPDEVAAKSLADVPAYDRKARELVFAGCWSLDDRLREGQFVCAKATPSSVAAITKVDDAHADVKIAQKLEPAPSLSEIDRACGGVTKPPSDVTVRLEKISTGWSAVANTTPVVAH